MPTDVFVVQNIFRQPYCWDFIASSSYAEYTISYQHPAPLVLTIFRSHPLRWFLSIKCRTHVVEVSIGFIHLSGSCSLHFDKLWIYVMIFFCSKKKLFLIWAVPICRYKVKYSKYKYKLHWFREMAGKCATWGSMISLTMGCWPGLQ